MKYRKKSNFVGLKEVCILSEEKLYQSLSRLHPAKGNLDVGIGDDGAVINCSGLTHLCVVKDVSVENIHFNLEWSSFAEVIEKTLIANLSDIWSMNAIPLYWLVGLTLPDHKKGVLDSYPSVCSQLSEKYHIQLIGGDVSSGSEMNVSITVIGNQIASPWLRTGLETGDELFLMGTPGLSGLGLDCFSGVEFPGIPKDLIESAKSYHRNPDIQSELKSFSQSKLNGVVAMDLSDGLNSACHTLASLSNVKIQLHESRFKFPDGFKELSSKDAISYYLNSGEEYFPIVGVPQGFINLDEWSTYHCFHKIGEVVNGNGVEILTQSGKICKLNKMGYSHF